MLGGRSMDRRIYVMIAMRSSEPSRDTRDEKRLRNRHWPQRIVSRTLGAQLHAPLNVHRFVINARAR